MEMTSCTDSNNVTPQTADETLTRRPNRKKVNKIIEL